MASIVQGASLARTKARHAAGTPSKNRTISSPDGGPASESPRGDALCDTASPQSPRLIPLTEWAKHHDWPPVGGLRHLVFFEKTNDFDKVVKRVGRRVLIDEGAFFQWVETQNKQV